MRLATPLAIVVLLALLGGCGDGKETKTTPEPGDRRDATTLTVQAAWEGSPGCERPPGASRWGCSVGAYRCQGVVVDRGWSVSCAKPGRSISFRVPPG